MQKIVQVLLCHSVRFELFGKNHAVVYQNLWTSNTSHEDYQIKDWFFYVKKSRLYGNQKSQIFDEQLKIRFNTDTNPKNVYNNNSRPHNIQTTSLSSHPDTLLFSHLQNLKTYVLLSDFLSNTRNVNSTIFLLRFIMTIEVATGEIPMLWRFQFSVQ